MDKPVFSYDTFASAARQVIAEGCVLLRNKQNALPLQPGSRAAVFGRTQMNYFKSGLGSGGLVNTRYVTGIYEALEKGKDYILDAQVRQTYEQWIDDHPFEFGDGWAHHPWFQQEMPLDEQLVMQAAQRNDAAIVLIGRTAGEDRDNQDEPGSWKLTSEEERMLELVCRHFSRSIVLLNTGNIIDMTWVERFDPSAVMYVWQGGQEGGTGVADVLTGRVCPSGRLTDTIARSIADYPSAARFGAEDKCVYTEDIYVGYRYFESFAPEKVLYHFGEGLSYTEFSHSPLSMAWDGSAVTLRHSVKNTGSCAGKEVVQVYAQLPQGKLGKPALVLCDFTKTDCLQPGENADIQLTFAADRLASYEDSGLTGNRSCFVLEAGTYRIFAGHSVNCLEETGSFEIAETVVLSRHEEACAPAESFMRMRSTDGTCEHEPVPTKSVSFMQRRAQRLPEAIAQTGHKGFQLEDVAAGRCTMEEFIAQLTDDDLCCIVRGEGMSSPRVTPGTAGAFGGVTDRLRDEFGIPAACCADGPSGIRMDCGNTAFSMPNGTLQASTWNEKLLTELYVLEGLEMRKYQVDSLLGPGMNIHRHPLNGRNFEYFSEDPLITGRMASAQLRGLHESGVTGTIKHYASNNQEYCRRSVNSIVSERALREIYLKGFEIAVKEGGARSVMTTYNPLNGCWTASHYDLVTTVLRDDWGFDGIVMTDWWAAGSGENGEDSSISNVAAMVRAQNDLFMVTNEPSANSGKDNSAESLADGSVTRAEYQRCAMNICRFILDTPAFRRHTGQVSAIDEQLRQLRDDEGDVILHVPEISVGEEAFISGDELEFAGKQALYQIKLETYGQYRIDITCRASDAVPDTAQLPLSVFIDAFLMGTRVLNGAEKEWQILSFSTPEIRRRLIYYSKFFMPVGGLEIKEVRITRTQTFE